MKAQAAFSLIELIVAVAIVAILSAIALPMYTDYVDTARRAVMTDSMSTIQLFQEEARLSGGTYQAATYDPDDPSDTEGLTAKIGWSPGTASDEVTYVVDNVSSSSYRITATHTDGTEVQQTYQR